MLYLSPVSDSPSVLQLQAVTVLWMMRRLGGANGKYGCSTAGKGMAHLSAISKPPMLMIAAHAALRVLHDVYGRRHTTAPMLLQGSNALAGRGPACRVILLLVCLYIQGLPSLWQRWTQPRTCGTTTAAALVGSARQVKPFRCFEQAALSLAPITQCTYLASLTCPKSAYVRMVSESTTYRWVHCLPALPKQKRGHLSSQMKDPRPFFDMRLGSSFFPGRPLITLRRRLLSALFLGLQAREGRSMIGANKTGGIKEAQGKRR